MSLQSGLYKNKLDAIMEVMHPLTHRDSAFLTLGRIWVAKASFSPFGVNYYLVTEESMEDAGYTLIQPNEREEI